MSGGLESYAYTALRVVAGLLFACHGLQKAAGLFGGRVADYTSLLGLAGFIETIGGVLIALGIAAGPVAFICSGEMAVAYFRAHHPRELWPIQNGGEPAVLFCFIFLLIATRGAGRFSFATIARKDRTRRAR